MKSKRILLLTLLVAFAFCIENDTYYNNFIENKKESKTDK